MVKAVIFDLYETLITGFDPDWVPPERSIADRLGVDEREFQARFERLGVEWELGRISGFGELLRMLCDEAGVAPPESLTSELVDERRAQFAPLFEDIDPAIVEMVESVKAHGLQVAVVTNVPNLQIAGWEASELVPRLMG